jgi:conjugative transposon TraM protein
MKPHSQKFIQRRKFVMALPVLVLPFLTMIFWALGGGQGTAASTAEANKAGLNPELPNAQFNNDPNDWDKLSLYQKAQRDSIKYNEAKRNDPYFKSPPLKGSRDTIKNPRGNVNTSLGKKDPWIDENEERVNKKLSELYKNLNTPVENERKPRYEREPIRREEVALSEDVERLETMMEMMQSNGAEDEEMKEIQSVLDKILDIQHPERVKERLRQFGDSSIEKTFNVSAGAEPTVNIIDQHIATIDSSIAFYNKPNRFYSLNETGSISNAPKSFEAEIYDEQTLVSGSIVKIKLVKDIYVNGSLVPKDQFVYGVCALNGERMNITINSIRYGQEIFPISLSVFDLDGLEGVHVPGSIARDVSKQSSNLALQDVQLNTLDPSIGVQAASAGIETVKSLMSKKTRLIRVTVKAGYKVLLVDTNNR